MKQICTVGRRRCMDVGDDSDELGDPVTSANFRECLCGRQQPMRITERCDIHLGRQLYRVDTRSQSVPKCTGVEFILYFVFFVVWSVYYKCERTLGLFERDIFNKSIHK
jgi:hypothetical protein